MEEMHRNYANKYSRVCKLNEGKSVSQNDQEGTLRTFTVKNYTPLVTNLTTDYHNQVVTVLEL